MKEVRVVNPPGEKEHFTVALAITASGKKLPAIVVFRGAKKTGKLSKNIEESLKLHTP